MTDTLFEPDPVLAASDDAVILDPADLSPAHLVTLQIAGVNRTCNALDGLVIAYGRNRVTEQPDPAHAAVVIAGQITAELGDPLIVDVWTAGAGTVRRFTGTITDLDVALDAGADLSQTRIVAVSSGLGRLSRRMIGAEPWPVEDAGARIGRHLTAAGVPAGVIDSDVVDVIAEDRDRTEALELAQIAAADALGVLVDELDGRVSYHAAARRAAPPLMVLDACDTETGAVSSQRVGDLINRIRVSYGDDGTGQPTGEEASEDPGSISRFGAYDVTRRTTLATDVDAAAIANRATQLYAWPAWTLPKWSIPLHLLDPLQADAIAALEISDAVELVNCPPPLPGQIVAYVEGWTETLTAYTRDLDLTLSDAALSHPVTRWRDLGSSPRWVDLPTPAPAWVDLWSQPI